MRACRALIREGNAVVGSVPQGALRDAVMITSAQKVDHYEMASYGTARTYAQVLGEPRVAQLLAETLEEEKVRMRVIVVRDQRSVDPFLRVFQQALRARLTRGAQRAAAKVGALGDLDL